MCYSGFAGVFERGAGTYGQAAGNLRGSMPLRDQKHHAVFQLEFINIDLDIRACSGSGREVRGKQKQEDRNKKDLTEPNDFLRSAHGMDKMVHDISFGSYSGL
jgi:hypothetical protein